MVSSPKSPPSVTDVGSESWYKSTCFTHISYWFLIDSFSSRLQGQQGLSQLLLYARQGSPMAVCHINQIKTEILSKEQTKVSHSLHVMFGSVLLWLLFSDVYFSFSLPNSGPSQDFLQFSPNWYFLSFITNNYSFSYRKPFFQSMIVIFPQYFVFCDFVSWEMKSWHILDVTFVVDRSSHTVILFYIFLIYRFLMLF